MKKKTRIFVVIAGFLLAGAVALTVFAESGGYSNEHDPLVTLSYVEKLRTQLLDELTQKLQALMENGQTQKPEEASASYTVVSLTAGQKLMAVDSCEVILRSGSASVIVSDETNRSMNIGLSDATAAAELLHGTDVPVNHYIIIPRGDGRGMLVSSDIAYFMVRGEYQIVS